MNRIESVDAIRAHQRRWLEETRVRAAEGEPFVICTSDELEEPLAIMGVPVLVINYWNFVLLAQGKGEHFTQVLHAAGYPGAHFFGLGYASSLDPDEAPWGGLPRPAAIISSTRNDYESRVTELWARHVGAAHLEVDFNFQGPFKAPPPDDWWRRIREEWRHLVDADQLKYRMAENERVIAELSRLTGRRFERDAYSEFAERLNDQMDVMMDASGIIGSSREVPASFRDQMAAYQAMWHRGTQHGLALAEAYRDELAQRVADGIAAHERPRIRALYWTNNREPALHGYLRAAHGAAIVASPYSEMPSVYARDPGPEPLEALAAKQLFLFDLRSRTWMLHAAARHRADLIIGVERYRGEPSLLGRVAEEAGIPYLAISDSTDTPEDRARIDEFFATRF